MTVDIAKARALAKRCADLASIADAGKQDRSGLGVVAKKQVDRVARLPGSDGSAGGTARGWRWPQHAAMVRNAACHVHVFHHYRHFQHLVKAPISVKSLRKFHEMWYFQRMLKDHHPMKEAEARAHALRLADTTFAKRDHGWHMDAAALLRELAADIGDPWQCKRMTIPCDDFVLGLCDCGKKGK